MESTLCNERHAGSHHTKPPTFNIPYIDNNNRCDRDPNSTVPTGFRQPTPLIFESAGSPYPSSDPPTLEDDRGMYSSQLLHPSTMIYDGRSHFAAETCGTVYVSQQPQVLLRTDEHVMLGLGDVAIRPGQGTEYTSVANPCLSATIEEHQPRKKAKRASAACDHCRDAKAKCDENTPCDACDKKNIKCTRRDNPPKKSEVEMLALLQKIYSIVSDPSAKFDRKQSAGKRNSPIPVHPSMEHSSRFSNGFAHGSTKGGNSHSNSKDRSTSPFADIPTPGLSDVNQESLASAYDEAEWDSNILWSYIEMYHKATVYSSGIIPREKLDRMVNQFLIDRENWAERSGADIDVAIVFLALSIGKLYENMPSSSFLPFRPSVRLGQGIQADGSTFFKLGEDTFHKCFCTDLIKNAQANALIGFYYYQIGIIPAGLKYLCSASQLARDLLLLKHQQLYRKWLSNEPSTEDRNILMLHIACLSLER
ncbi:hypothetical protein F5Y03DRAFT_405869 [Xylaria venustula]|nr:hypothetical protein F5Y03DRAFT_405869 [Xylaria venustula]